MKKLIALFLTLLMLPAAALAEFDTAALLERENVLQSMDANWDTVYSLSDVFYMGEIEDGTLLVTLDYIKKAELDMTLVRVDVLLMIYDLMAADTVTFTVGGKNYAFAVQADVFEYDGVYQEDYVICLTDASLPFLKALAQQKKDDPIPVTFSSLGEALLTGRVVIPGEASAQLYDLYVDLGGKKQELKEIDELWPCEITVAK